MSKTREYSLGPFILLAFMYFIVGFMTTINGQLQGPLQIAFLSEVEVLRNTLVTLIPFFFFFGYLMNSAVGGKWINAHGYKVTLIRATMVMIGGLLFYLLATFMATYLDEYGVNIGSDYIPYGYMVFLIGSFLMGTSAAILQVVINPYVASYKLPNTQTVQRMSIVGACNSFGTTIAPFFVTGVMFAGVAMEDVSSSQLINPFILMAIFTLIVTAFIYRANLPDIEGTFTKKGESLTRSVWSFRHLTLGVIAVFFYVGGEVCIGLNINLHAMELLEKGQGLTFMGHNTITLWGLDLGIPALLATLYWGGLMVGRILSGFISFISARTQVIFTATMAMVFTAVAMSFSNLWILVAVGLFHSIMWGALFTLAVNGLKKYTSRGSGVFMMGVFGGAVLPLIQGYMADMFGSWQSTWMIVVVCEMVILSYAIWGSRVVDKECL